MVIGGESTKRLTAFTASVVSVLDTSDHNSRLFELLAALISSCFCKKDPEAFFASLAAPEALHPDCANMKVNTMRKRKTRGAIA
jgi:hypothetical protein